MTPTRYAESWADDVWTGGEIPESVSIEEAKQEIRRVIAEVRELAASLDERIDWDYSPEPTSWGDTTITAEEHQRHGFGHVLGNLNSAHLGLSDIQGC